MLSSTSIVASSSRALPTTTLGRGQRQEVPSRRATSTMSTRALTTTHRCRHHFVDAPSPRRLLRASPRHRFSRPVVASASSSSSGDRDDAVLKSIVEAAAAAAKAARASEASAASTTSFASVSSSDEASSSGLRGATVSPRRTRLITFTCNKCGESMRTMGTSSRICFWLDAFFFLPSGPFFSPVFLSFLGNK